MSITRLDFRPIAQGGDNPTAAFVKLDANAADLDTRLAAVKVTADASATKAYVDQQDATKLPSASPVFTGGMTKKGVANVDNFRILNVAGETGIGGAFSDWAGNRTSALQVDAMNPLSSFMTQRVTHWGVRHEFAQEVYAGGTTTSMVMTCFNFDTGIQKHIFYSNGSATFAGALTQNSDYRIKEEKREIDPESAAAGLRAARPIEYRDIRDPEDSPLRAGFIAHEFQGCFPLLVHGEKDATEWTLAYAGDTTPYPPGEEPEGWTEPVPYPVETPVLQNVDYIGQVPYLTAGWQQHDRRIADLETKLAAALARLDALEGAAPAG